MKRFLTAGAVLAASLTGAIADLCAEGFTDDNGNWYCQEVTAITYTGAGGAGSYNKVTDMDSSSGTCSSSAYGYSGSMAPLDEEVSLHFRGPLALKKFAAYTPSSSSSKKNKKRHAMSRRHGHSHFHERQEKIREIQNAAEKRQAAEKRSVGSWVTATIDGQVVSWINEYSGEAATTAAAAATTVALAAAATTPAAVRVEVETASSVPTASSAASSTSSTSSTSSSSSGSGSWGQIAYYDSESQSASGVTFLNHLGGSGSGVWDDTFGNSLSYAAADGSTCAASPQVLADTTLASDEEIVIMSDKQCDGDCGYVRPGTVAYHGFDGPLKAFFFEFEMPLDPTNNDAATNGNMPAIWMLNAQIPLTMQYGQADCSCWTSGCGEFDIFEVLAPGDLRAKSSLHGNISGGDSDYFARPISGTITAVLLMDGNDIHIQILDDFDWSSSLDASYIDGICTSTATQTPAVSIFTLA